MTKDPKQNFSEAAGIGALRVTSDSLEPIRDIINQVSDASEALFVSLKPIRAIANQVSDASAALFVSLEPIANKVAKAIRPYQDLAEGHLSILGLLEQENRARPAFESDWVEAFKKRFQQLEEALRNAESMGKAGWTVPLNADTTDCILLLSEATSAESADLAFINFYTKDDGVHLVELVADLLNLPELKEWKPLLEVIFALDAKKYRLVVPALLSNFEGVAHSIWTDQFYHSNGRRAFFDRKLKGFQPGSYDDLQWRALKAFVMELYAQAHDKRPLSLNRHWILHGREPASAKLADCLRLLQAIYTAVTLGNCAQPPHETKQASS
jgi:hypothetical protein